jgi:hypothetical protein
VYRLIALSFALLTANVASAQPVCVNTATQFRDALAAAETNGKADDIRLQIGVYSASAQQPFAFTVKEPHGITISGGWGGPFGGCIAQTTSTNPSTVLDGGGSINALRISVTITHAVVPISVSYLAVRNGRSVTGTATDAAGIAIVGVADSAPVILVDRIVAEQNVGTGVAAAVYLASDHGFVRFTNSIIRANQTANAAAVSILSNAGGSALHHLSILNNNRTTSGGAVEWWGSAPGQMKSSLIWGTTGSNGDLHPDARVQYTNNRYQTLIGAFGATSSGNAVLAAPQLDQFHRPAVGSPLREVGGTSVGTRDVFNQPRKLGGASDIGAAEGV